MNEASKNKDSINKADSVIDNINKNIEKLAHDIESISNDFETIKSNKISILEDIVQVNTEMNQTSQKLEHIKTETDGIFNIVEQLKEEKENVIISTKKDIKSWCKKCSLLIFGGWSILTVISLISIYFGVKNKTETFITKEITQKFAEPQIALTFTSVAENEAKKIIEDRLTPAIKVANQSVSEKLISFENSLQEFKDTYDIELKKLTVEVEFLKSRNEIMKLGDEAIANRDAISFEKLERIMISSKDIYIKQSALSEILRVKNFISSGTSIRGVDVTYLDPNTGSILKNDKIPTSVLINGLIKNKSDQERAKIAQLLNKRKEKQVPEVLLNAIKNDKDLEVRKEAMDSFEAVTGFKSTDVLMYDPAIKWWNENKAKVESNLKDSQMNK
jgi:hypothetical protein